jgi:hypothetical protein
VRERGDTTGHSVLAAAMQDLGFALGHTRFAHWTYPFSSQFFAIVRAAIVPVLRIVLNVALRESWSRLLTQRCRRSVRSEPSKLEVRHGNPVEPEAARALVS